MGSPISLLSPPYGTPSFNVTRLSGRTPRRTLSRAPDWCQFATSPSMINNDVRGVASLR